MRYVLGGIPGTDCRPAETTYAILHGGVFISKREREVKHAILAVFAACMNQLTVQLTIAGKSSE